jgi:hypothetical protein
MFNKRSKLNNRGSALVLTVIVLVNALLIVAAISAISVIERKLSSRAKNSTPAFQAADSGVEWVLFKVANENDPIGTSLADVFGAGNMDGNGRYDCSSTPLSVDCEFYFIDVIGQVILDQDTRLIDIDSVRAVGRAGVQEEQVSRAIEVMMEIAHCPPDFIPVGDYCVYHDDLPAENFSDAAKVCAEDYEARLCRAGEWFVACELSRPGEVLENELVNMVDGYEWVDDYLADDRVLVIGSGGQCDNTAQDDPIADSNRFRCCINLQQ